MRFSRRTDWHTSPNPLAQVLEARRRSGARVLDLTLSNPTRAGFRYLKRSLLKGLVAQENLVYDPDPRGLLAAREAVCQYYLEKGITLDPSQIFLTAGTSEAYTFVLRLLADPGDTVLVPSPSYPLFDYLAALGDVQAKPYSLIYTSSGWRPDLGSVSDQLGVTVQRPRAVFVVQPNNPTGNLLTAAEREALDRAVSEAGAAVVSDEVFLDFAYEKGSENESFAAGDARSLTFTLSGISKVLGLPQMKLSWIAVTGPKALRARAMERLEVIADTYLSVSTPSQRALPGWFERRPAVLHEIQRRVHDNRASLARALKKHPKARVLRADGGWYAVVRFESARSDESIALELLEKHGVHVHPGYFFDFKPDEHLVVSLLVPPAEFREAAARIAEALA